MHNKKSNQIKTLIKTYQELDEIIGSHDNHFYTAIIETSRHRSKFEENMSGMYLSYSHAGESLVNKWKATADLVKHAKDIELGITHVEVKTDQDIHYTNYKNEKEYDLVPIESYNWVLNKDKKSVNYKLCCKTNAYNCNTKPAKKSSMLYPSFPNSFWSARSLNQSLLTINSMAEIAIYLAENLDERIFLKTAELFNKLTEIGAIYSSKTETTSFTQADTSLSSHQDIDGKKALPSLTQWILVKMSIR